MKAILSQVAASVPFDKAGLNFSSDNVQDSLQEIHRASQFDSTSTEATNSGTLTLTASDNSMQFITGSGITNFSVSLPPANTVFKSRQFIIVNQNSLPITVKDGAGNTLVSLGQTSVGIFFLQTDSSVAGVWVYWQTYIGTATGIVSYYLNSSTAFATTSATDVVITGFTTTPVAGTYAVWYSSSNTNTSNNSVNSATIYRDDSALTDSVRSFQTGSSNMQFQLNTITIASFNGSQVCDVRVKRTTGTLTVNGRSLIMIRLGT